MYPTTLTFRQHQELRASACSQRTILFALVLTCCLLLFLFLQAVSACSSCKDFVFVLTCCLFFLSFSVGGKCIFALHNFVQSSSDVLTSLVPHPAGGKCMFILHRYILFRSDVSSFLVFLFCSRYVHVHVAQTHFCFVLTCRFFSFPCSAGGMCKFTLHKAPCTNMSLTLHRLIFIF